MFFRADLLKDYVTNYSRRTPNAIYFPHNFERTGNFDIVNLLIAQIISETLNSPK